MFKCCMTVSLFLISAVVFALNPNERQINTRIGVREKIVRKRQAIDSHYPERIAKSNYFG